MVTLNGPGAEGGPAQHATASDAERKRVLYEWNNTRSPFPDVCAHHLFERQAARTPDAVAVVSKDGRLTYRELNERANQVAHFLRRNGVGPETLVGVCLERSLELVIGLLGVWKAGGAYIPLDPAYPTERLSFMVGDAGIRVLLTESKCRGLFPSSSVAVVCLDDDWPSLAREITANPSTDVSPANLAYVMYTSGSTGQPKGAMILHAGLVNYLCWAIETYAVEPGASVPVHSSIAFDLTVTSLYPALLAGGQAELLAEDVGAQNLIAALRARRNRCLVKITPAHLDVLTHELRAEELAGLTKTFVIGGENLPAESLNLWRDLAPSSRLINEYGPTETVVGCCIHEVGPSDRRNGPVPIGRPIANTELYVLDEGLQPVSLGEMGELYVGGAGVARGYLNRPDLTRERFLPDPFSGRAGARLYKTGDLARYRSDGILEFLGRVDNQVKVRGYRIELGEVEAALAGHPAVQSCAVLAREDTTANKQLVGYVVLRTGQKASAEELQTFVKRQLPEYMVPAHIVFLDSLPLTVNGKVDRKALPAPSTASATPSRKFTAPRNETEKSIVAIWSELLKVEDIGIDDDFFELGGHSLVAIRALARIRDRLDVDLPPQTLFEHSTVAALAALIMKARGEVQVSHPIPRRGTDGPCAVSFAQQQLWLLDQLVPGSPAYNIVDVVPIHGDYDPRALNGALRELVRRHEILRTVYARPDGRLVQAVLPPFEPSLADVDLSVASEEERQREWTRVVREQGRKPFDLAQLPLIRATVVHVSPAEHRVFLTIHHIIADEWSMELIHKELIELYTAFSQGHPSPLQALPIQYADFAVWQRESLQGEVLQGQLDYWKKELEGALQVLALPADRPRSTTPTLRGATESFALPKEVLARLQSLGRQEQATLFMMLEAAFALLLYRYTGQDDILVGTPISGRTHSETQRLIGCFLNTVVLRTQFPVELNFRELLRQVRGRALGAFAHAELPFERLVEELSPGRDLGRTPLFQAMFILHSRDGVSQVSKVSGYQELETGTSKFDLTLFMAEKDNALEGLIEYSTDLFETETVRRLCRSFARLLAAAAADPDQSVSRLPLLADADRRRLVVDWNRTALESADAGLCLHQLFARQAAASPERIALSFGHETMTYAEVDRRSDQLARHLIALGVGPDMLVGLLVERSFEMVVGMLGILKAGGAYVPLDPSFPRDRLAYTIDDAQMQVLIAHRGLDGTLNKRPATVVHLDGDWDEISNAKGSPSERVGVAPGNLAYVLYTSGSTGMPKGVAIPHSAMVNFLLSMQHEPGFTPSDTLLAVTTLSFDIAGLELYLPLVSGAKVVIASREDAVDPHRLMHLLRDRACTFLQATPATWRALVDAGWKGTPGLKALCGGEAMPLDLAQALIPRCAELWNMYGPTETTVWSTVHKVVTADAQPPIGHPIANTQVYVLDGHMDLVPPGAVGELYIGGQGLARGYLHREELTRERFVPSPFEPNARLYRTGDLARWRVDGVLECLGRTDHQVKLRGYRIELGEIEACIARHSGVRQVVVVAREDVPGDKRLVAYIVPNQPPPDLVEQLRAQLRAAVPDYMVPAHFVSLDVLPLTPNGKVDRKALPAPRDTELASGAGTYVAPRTELEISLASAWQRVLGIARVGIHDNLFDLGGNSLAVVKLMLEMEKATGIEIALGTIFRFPTIAGLVGSFGSGAAEDASLIVPLQPEGDGLPVFCLSGILLYQEFANSLGKGQPVFGVYVAEEHALTKQALRGEKVDISSAQLAKGYYDAIVRVAPKGPYRLAGVSFGGIVALEVASMMRRNGAPVEMVVLLDTLSPRATRRNWIKWALRRARQLMTGEGRSKALRKLASIREKFVARLSATSERDEARAAEDAHAIKQAAFYAAIHKWTADRLSADFRIVLFRASDQDWGPAFDFEHDYGWHHYLGGPLLVVDVSGDHLGILKTPHVAELGRKVQEHLSLTTFGLADRQGEA
jgi:amino acid adenylation domain-containing protein